jgi:xanthine dehydrogenase molybdenum-binding subunit
VITSCSDLGTGAHTALKQIAAETLGFGLDEIHMLVGNSDASGFDIGAHASRTIFTGGGAVIAACEDAKKQLFDRAARQLEANVEDLEMKDKKIFVKGSPEKSIDIKTITSLGVYNFVDPATGKTIGIPGQIQGYASHFAPHHSPPFAACFMEVEVDIETGEVKVLEAVQAYDVGQAIHPPSCEGQNEGAMQQGIGMALMEEIYYDKNGLCLNSSFTDYKTPGPSDMPKCKVILVEEPDPLGPYGAKSCGEGGLANPPGAVLNAIRNAIGIQITDVPATPEKILKAIKEQGIK